MTKETKIGLLVGLAFIILFAIILSEKGAGPRPQGTPQFTQVDRTQRGVDRTGSSLTDAGKLSLPVEPVRIEPSRRTHTKPAPTSPVATASPADRRDEVSLPTLDPSLIGDKTAVAGGSNTQSPVIALGDFVGPVRTDEKSWSAPLATADSSKSKRSSELAASVKSLQTKLDSLAARTNTATENVEPVEPVAVTEDSPPTAAASVDGDGTYVVQPGDTLTTIAKRTCGHCGPSTIDSICTANSKTLKNRNSLVVGQKLIIPKPAGRIITASGEAETAPNAGLATAATSKADSKKSAATKSKGTKTVAAGATRTYRVKAKDTLSRIAKEQLGDARRYREIVELNRGVLGDHNRIRPGMKLKLPARGAAATSIDGGVETSAREGGEKTIAL